MARNNYESRSPVAEDIELVVSEPEEGGYIVERLGRPQDEHEWLPEEMIPENLLNEYDAREQELDTISEDMDVGR